MDRGQLIENVVRSVEEQLVPGASEAISDLSSMVPDRPGAPDLPNIPYRSGLMPQAPGLPQPPAIPQTPEIPQAPRIPDAAQNGLDRAQRWDDQARRANDMFGPDEQRHASEHAHREKEANGFADSVETDEEPQPERTPFPEDEDQATAVLRVCRNGWNVLDTRAVGGHWWSA